MKGHLCVRPLTAEERAALAAGLKSREAFVVRRCQPLLASGRGEGVVPTARAVGRGRRTARDVIHGFNADGLASLARKSNRPKSAKPEPDEGKRQRLKALLRQGPRTFAKPTTPRTSEPAAEVAHERGPTAGRVSDETVRRASEAMGTSRKRAEHRITSPDPQYAREKSDATG